MVALVLGILSMACGGAVAGLPAIILGSIARRDIDQSNGVLQGRALAAGGIVSGLFGTGFGIVVFLWVADAVFTPPSPDPVASVDPSSLSPAGDAPEAPAAKLSPPRDVGQARASGLGPSRAEEPPAIPTSEPALPGIRSYGSLDVVDLDASRPLRAQLTEILDRAHGRTVVLQTVTPSSSACRAVAAALPELRMQHALANVTLVRVEIEEYDRELAAMKLETRTAPWFYKLDTHGSPTDAISSDAWANVPENMAPALGKFVSRSAPRGRR